VLLEAEMGTNVLTVPPPPLQGSQLTTWADLGRIIAILSEMFAEEEETIERRWRKVLFLVATLRNSTFDGGGDPKKAITGPRLTEFLTILSEATEDEVPDDPDEVPAPGWVGRTVFRQVSALYARKDTGPDRGSAQSSAVARLFSAMQFARGRGTIPRTHSAIPRTTFAAAEKPFEELSEKSERLLARWARVKIESGQFCGPTNFNMPVWDGLESLAVAFAAAMWLTRVLVTDGRPQDDAVMMAVRIVDDNFGFNPLLGQGRQKFALRLLGKQGELPKLVAWYGK
jgi:lysine-N-methylase